MVRQDIKIYPDPVLRKNSEAVKKVDDNTLALIKDMFEIMKEAGGIGLAAPQLGISKRIIVLSLNEKGFDRLALIDPVIEFFSKETVFMEEGCLSLPEINAKVERSFKVIVKGITRSGRLVEINGENLLARVLQHEIDHLNSVLFIDRLGSQEKKRVENDLEALHKRHSALTQ